MKPELRDKLYEKYPKIFRQKDLSIRESCMSWGFECGDGWYNLLDTLCSAIQWRIDENSPRVCTTPFYRKIWNRFLIIIENRVRLFGFKHNGLDNTKKSYSMGEYESRSHLTKACEHFTYYLQKKSCNTYKTIPIPQVEAVQVKEKYGSLCFYYSGGDEQIDGMIQMAEQISGIICEVCGSPGEICSRNGWLKILCPSCHKKKEHKGYKKS